MKKNKIESVKIEHAVDEYPDTSFIGEYTNKKTAWSICSHCGEFIAIAEKPNERAEEIEDEIYDLENEDETLEISEQIEKLKKELAGLELHECPHTRREFNYFLPYAGGEKPGSENYQKYGKQDFDRMESLNNGNWCFIGIIAKAKIVTENGTIQTIRSGGLWGIESDSDKSYIAEIEQEQLAELRKELTALGFGKRAIDYAYQNIDNEN